MRVLPAATDTVVVGAEHTAGQILFFGIQPAALGEDLRGLAFVIIGSVYPARGIKQCGNQCAAGIRMLLDPVPASAEHFFRMIRPDVLAGGGGKTDAVVDGAGIPGLTHAESHHVANTHVHHHLRRRYHYRSHIGKRVNAAARQPVIKPHGVSAGREGVGEGIGARLTVSDKRFQATKIGDALFLQIRRQGDPLAIAVQGHEVGHRLRFTGNTQLQPIQQTIENMSGIQFAVNQLVAYCRPAGLFARHQRNAVLFIEPFQGGYRQRRAVGQRDKPHLDRCEFRLIRTRRPNRWHHAGQ